MQDVSTERTWTLSGQSVRFGLLFTYVTDDSGSRMNLASDSEDLPSFLNATRLPGTRSPGNVEHMSLNSIRVGDFIESEEVLPWLREECRSNFSLHFGEVEDELTELDAAEGLAPHKEFKFFFRFYNMDDALRFKLQFGHVLDAGVCE